MEALTLWLEAEEFAEISAQAERRRLADFAASERLGCEIAAELAEQDGLPAHELRAA